MNPHNGIELIDHPVIAARDLNAARTSFERLGFVVPPRGSHVEWGTGNLCIMFPDDYVEVRGIIDASRFTMHLDDHLDAYGEGLMGVAFGVPDIERSHAELLKNGVAAGRLQKLSRNFEHPEGWTQPSFKLCAPEADDIEGLMHVVVIQHLTPDLLRRPEFLAHANTCIGVNAMSGTIYDKRRVAEKLRRLLGEAAVKEDIDGVRAVLPSGQRLELLMAEAYERKYGTIADSPEPLTPRLGAMTLRVASIDGLCDALGDRGVDFDEYAQGVVRVAAEHACGATLLFTESAPA
jgi:catechol 2,3-dioxygenase-like lactoylglutathione lyase family enzyme